MEPIKVRQDIVEAATRVFSDLGYHGASMQDIADAVGIRKASLYHHVRKKEDLLFAIHERLIDDLMDQTLAALADADSGAAKIAAILRSAMRFIAANREGVTVFLQERSAVAGDRWDGIVDKRDRYEMVVVEVIRDGIAAGEMVDLPVKIAARGLLAMSNWSYTWFNSQGSMTADEVADVFTRMVLSGLWIGPVPELTDGSQAHVLSR